MRISFPGLLSWQNSKDVIVFLLLENPLAVCLVLFILHILHSSNIFYIPVSLPRRQISLVSVLTNFTLSLLILQSVLQIVIKKLSRNIFYATNSAYHYVAFIHMLSFIETYLRKYGSFHFFNYYKLCSLSKMEINHWDLHQKNLCTFVLSLCHSGSSLKVGKVVKSWPLLCLWQKSQSFHRGKVFPYR